MALPSKTPEKADLESTERERESIFSGHGSCCKQGEIGAVLRGRRTLGLRIYITHLPSLQRVSIKLLIELVLGWSVCRSIHPSLLA